MDVQPLLGIAYLFEWNIFSVKQYTSTKLHKYKSTQVNKYTSPKYKKKIPHTGDKASLDAKYYNTQYK